MRFGNAKMAVLRRMDNGDYYLCSLYKRSSRRYKRESFLIKSSGTNDYESSGVFTIDKITVSCPQLLIGCRIKLKVKVLR